MKQLNNYLETAPYWVIFLIGFISASIISYLMINFVGVGDILIPTGNLIISTIFGCMGGGLYVLMVNMNRHREQFWSALQTLEAKVDAADTREEMDVLFDKDFIELVEIAQGTDKYGELITLRAIMRTKYKYLK